MEHSGFAAQAIALRWAVPDLFDHDDLCPFARLGWVRLIWLLHGDRLVVLTADALIIETSGARQTRHLGEIPRARHLFFAEIE